MFEFRQNIFFRGHRRPVQLVRKQRCSRRYLG